MSAIVEALLAELDDDALDALAERLAPRLLKRLALSDGHGHSEWMTTAEAARHMCATQRRIRDLVERGCVPAYKDGRRLRVRRSDLDAYLNNNAPLKI